MPTIDVYNVEGKKVSTVDLKEEIFGLEPNENIVQLIKDKVLKVQKLDLKLAVEGENLGDKKEQVELDKEV